MRIDFDWDQEKAASNATKHQVSFEEGMTIFGDPLSVSVLDDESSGEERWVTVGQTIGGNLLLVVHTWTENRGGSHRDSHHFGATPYQKRNAPVS